MPKRPITAALSNLKSSASAALASVVPLVMWLVAGMGLAHATDLTLAVADLPLFSPLLIAERQGYFKDEGLNVRVIHCPNGRRCLKYLTDGEAQVAAAADTPLMFASLEGKNFSIFATVTSNSQEHRWVALKSHGISKPADLKGKRLGVVAGTSSQYFAESFLLFYGISLGEVTFVSLDGANPHAALVRGEVDAAALYQPHVYVASQALGVNALMLNNPRLFSTTVNLASSVQKDAPSHANLVKVLRAVQRANRLITDQPAMSRKLIADGLSIDDRALAATWSDYDFSLWLGQPLISALEGQARWAKRAGLAVYREVPDYLDFINTAPLLEVQRASVTLVK